VVDMEPVDVIAEPVAVDLSTLDLQKGTAYTITMAVDEQGNQTIVETEAIVPPFPQPATDLVVFRHKKTGKAYLGQLNGTGTWTVSFSNFENWQNVVDNFPVEDWVYTEVSLSVG